MLNAVPPPAPPIPPVPLLLDRADFAALCGVSVATLDRLVSAGELPPADRRVGPGGGCPRWRRETAEAAALVGRARVADLLRVGRSTVGDMVRAGEFPPPDSTHGRDRWRLSTVREFARRPR